MRLANLNGLEMGRHIRPVRHGRHTTFHIVIPAEEMKAARPFESILPAETAALLDTYLIKYRPRIAGGKGPYLFPGRGGARRAESQFGAQISRFISRETGLKMNPHLFRHLCGLLYLLRHPDDIETVRQLLGHASVRTTLKFYAQLSTVFAFLKWDEILAEEREGLPRRRSPTSKRLWRRDDE
jgi:integrase